MRNVGHCTLPDDIPVPTKFKSAALETPISTLEGMAEISGEDLDKEGTRGCVRPG